LQSEIVSFNTIWLFLAQGELEKTVWPMASQPFNRDIESTSIGHDGIEAHRPLHPLAYSFPHFLCLLRCWGSGTATNLAVSLIIRFSIKTG
jgi:hypothetical protein